MKKPIKCLIVDDEPLAINVIKRYVEQLPNMHLVATCDNALAAFEWVKQEEVDLIFLDIEMPMMTGIDFVRALKHPPSVIFTTAYRDYAIESYELHVVDYLLKPIRFQRFLQAVDKYLAWQQIGTTVISEEREQKSESPDSMFVNTNKKFVKIIFDDVTYVESLKDYVRIHLTNRSITTRAKISVFSTQLPSYFLRIHRSFIVNTKKITAYSTFEIEVETKSLPIGNSYKREVQTALENL